jgi:uncharacterized membrane protein (DUF373 family)
MKGDDTNFPIEVQSPLINFLQKVILWSIKILACLMVIVILWSVADVIFTLYLKTKESYLLMNDFDEVLTIFGGFLVVLIAIEIFLNIILYLKKDMGHLRLVMATALMAISRKVIILDYDQVSDWHMVGMGVLILSLGFAYWFICQSNQMFQPKQIMTSSEPPTNSEK